MTGALAGYPPATAVSAGPFSGSAEPRPRARRADRRAGARRRQRGPRLLLRPLRRAPVRRPEGGPLRSVAARQGDRADQARGHQGRARPLRRRLRRAVPAGRLAPRARRPHQRLRRAPSHLQGPDRMKEAPTMRRSILAAAAAALLLAPAAAQAHVTLQPDTAPAGGFTRLDVRVPNERDDAGTDQGRRPAPARLHRRVLRARARLEGRGDPLQGGEADRHRRGPEVRHAGLADHLDRRRQAGHRRSRASSRTSGCR